MHRAVAQFAGLMALISALPVSAQTVVERLYDGAAPGSGDWQFPEQMDRDGARISYRNVRNPEVSLYRPEEGNGSAVIILPGGGLRVLGVGDETDEQIRQFNDAGMAAILLKYRTLQVDPQQDAARDGGGPAGFPKLEIVNGNANPARGNAVMDEVLAFATADAQAALRWVRGHAGEWGIDPDRVGMLGTSAGGGVAMGALLAGEEGATPDFIISIFGPSLQDVTVPENPPPLFLAVEADHGPVTDGLVALHDIWDSAGAHSELHVYDVDTFAMPFSLWGDRALDWLAERGMLADHREGGE